MEDSMKRLEGKVAVVTGGNSGIGLAAAQRLHQEGAKIAISGRSQKTLEEAKKLLGADTLAVQADVSKLADIDKLYAAVAAKFSKFDILFVNAGIAKFIPFEDVTEEIYDEMFDINAKGAHFTIQKALPLLNDGGSIILDTSVAGQIGHPMATVYSATKAAMRSLTRSAAAALLERNIRVNAVAPGPIDTPIFTRPGIPEGAIDGFVSTVPMKRAGKAEEVAATVAFLASSDASFITGVEINVDGGIGQL
jgi:NAD(P)-dependent dehydrogenase (short-subunit alcohol dehydrogenase family)